jgi:hypothetical protein
MPSDPSRRSFIHLGTAFAAASCFGATAFAQDRTAPATTPSKKPPPIEPEVVREFVGAAHGNLEKTRSMLDQRPGLLNAVWDWGGGDFEAAIGGAGHMGRRDIAQFLIDRGARFDLFVAAMMGKIEIVRAVLSAFPQARSSKGPHGIDLMTHARKGGAEAAEVVRFLESLS